MRRGAAEQHGKLFRKNRFLERRVFLKIMSWSIALPYLANSMGWIMTEVGRQPWVVYGLQLTKDGVSPLASVPSLDIELSLLAFSLFYGAIAYAAVHLWKKVIGRGLDADPERIKDPSDVDSLFLGTGGDAAG